MANTFIDYSQEYTKSLHKIPEKQYGKFVVVNNEGERYLIFGTLDQYEFHANIVERFAISKKLAGCYNKNRDHFTIQEQGWLVSGGHWEYQSATHVLTLFGKSLAYGQADLQWVSTELKKMEAFDEARISIRH